MATLIPSRNSCLPRMTGGEKRVSERLEQKLEDDYLLWYDVPVGLKQRHPDFVVFHPRRGLLVLEVKDWKADTIRHADSTQFTLVTDRGLVKETSPLLQARAYALEIGVVLERDPALRHPEGSRYAGKLIMPWGWGVVLANITRKQFDEGALGEVLPEHLAICRDEIYDTVESEAFQERLWAMFPQVYPVALTLPQIDRVRWHLFPELRVEAGSGQFGLFGATDAAVRPLQIPDLIKVLAARLEQLIGERGLGEKVQVYNFHKWCRKMLVAYNVELPAQGSKDFFRQMVQKVIAGVDHGQIPRFQYGAVLIDGLVQADRADDRPGHQLVAGAVRRRAEHLRQPEPSQDQLEKPRRAGAGPHHHPQAQLSQHTGNPFGGAYLRAGSARLTPR